MVSNSEYANNEDSDLLLIKHHSSYGILTYQMTDSCQQRRLDLFDEDGARYCSIDIENNLLYFEQSGDLALKMDSQKIIRPYEYYSEYMMLKFEIQSVSDQIVKVFYRKDKKDVKLIHNNNCLIFETWKQYYMGSMVSFDPVNNPIRVDHDDSSDPISIGGGNYDDMLFVISEVDGEWIEISCADICGFICDEVTKGWIRWIKNGQELIRINSSC